MAPRRGDVAAHLIFSHGPGRARYDLDFQVGAGFEAQLGPLAPATPKKKLYEKRFSYDEPGCATG